MGLRDGGDRREWDWGGWGREKNRGGEKRGLIGGGIGEKANGAGRGGEVEWVVR